MAPAAPRLSEATATPVAGGSRAAAFAGVAAFAFAVAWVFVAAAIQGGTPWPAVGLVGASGAALGASWLLTGIRRWVVPAAVLVVAVAAALPSDAFDREPLGGPFGYVNATGGFYLLAAIAGLMVASCSRHPAGRAGAIAGAAVCAAVPFAADSAAASILVIVVPGLALAASVALSPRVATAMCALLAVGALAATAALGAAHEAEPGAIDRAVDATLSERRTALWHDAIAAIRAEPLAGVGPGRFETVSPTARSDPDARWAHNDFLEHGAETGLPGLAGAVVIVGWSLWASGGRADPDTTAALGAAAVAALAVAASVDYLLHFPALPVTAAALAGAGARRRTRSDSLEGRDHVERRHD